MVYKKQEKKEEEEVQNTLTLKSVLGFKNMNSMNMNSMNCKLISKI